MTPSGMPPRAGFGPLPPEFAADSPLEQTGFEPSVPRKASTGRKLLTPDHDEFIGRGLGAPDLALAPSKLPHAGVAVGERKGLETLGFGIEAQDRVCSPVADPHATGVIDIDGVGLRPVAWQMPTPQLPLLLS